MKRDLTVDVARGIGMILVVAGHSRVNELFGGFGERWIFSFHMPLFFLLAGYCFNEAKYPSWPGYVKRKVLAIWWPFVMCSLFIAVVSAGLYWGDDPTMSFASQCKSLLTLNTRISPFWFLPVLFAVEIAYWWIRRLPRKWEYALLAACLIVGGFCFKHNHAYHDVTFLVAVVWYGIGKGMRDGWKFGRLDGCKASCLAGLAAACFVLHAILVHFGLNGVVSYAGGKWINPWVHFPACFFALIGVMAISRLLSIQHSNHQNLRHSNPITNCLVSILSWIGINSMAILAVHAFPGIYRRTWITAWGMPPTLSYVLELAVLCGLVWLLVQPLKKLVRF